MPCVIYQTINLLLLFLLFLLLGRWNAGDSKLAGVRFGHVRIDQIPIYAWKGALAHHFSLLDAPWRVRVKECASCSIYFRFFHSLPSSPRLWELLFLWPPFFYSFYVFCRFRPPLSRLVTWHMCLLRHAPHPNCLAPTPLRTQRHRLRWSRIKWLTRLTDDPDKTPIIIYPAGHFQTNLARRAKEYHLNNYDDGLDPRRSSAALYYFFLFFWKGEKEDINITSRHLADTFIQIYFHCLPERGKKWGRLIPSPLTPFPLPHTPNFNKFAGYEMKFWWRILVKYFPMAS